MTGRLHLRLLIPVTLGIFLLSAIGLSSCSQAGQSTPLTNTPTGGTTTPAPVDQTAPSQVPPAAMPVQVTLSGFAFSPSTVTVPVGTTITWTNKDVTHTVSSRAGLFESGNLPRGATFSHTFNQKGTFDYYCKIHPSITGKIIVGE